MSTQNVIRTENCCYPFYRGSVGQPTANITWASTNYIASNSACHRLSTWFKGHLITVRYYSNSWRLIRYDSINNTWENLSYSFSLSSAPYAMPGLISFKNRVYLFWDYYGQNGGSTTYNRNHQLRFASWTAWGLSDQGGNVVVSNYTTRQFEKSSDYQDCEHITDLIVYNNMIYVATAFGIYSTAPHPDYDISSTSMGSVGAIYLPSSGEHLQPCTDEQCSKCFSVFNSPSGVFLYCLFSDGRVGWVGSTFNQTADLTLVNSAIDDGVDLSGGKYDVSIGYAGYLCQLNNKLYAFLNASGTGGTGTSGIVLFESSDGINWTEKTDDIIPSTWKTQNGHIHGCIDAAASGECRIVFVADTGGFDEYKFTGSGMELISTNGPLDSTTWFAYDFWDKDAPDVEMSGCPSIDLEKAVFNYRLFREVPTENVEIIPEYSTDGGATWQVATRKTGVGDPTTGLSAGDLKNAPQGSGYVFAWDWVNDIGSTQHVLFRLRAKNT